jgi:hypothetical protein
MPNKLHCMIGSRKPRGRGEPTDEADRGRHTGFARYDVFAGGPGSLSLSFAVRTPEDADIREVSVNATTYWNKLKKTGWLNHLPATEHAEIKEQVARNLADEPQQAYAALAQGIIDAGESSPAEILRILAESSDSLFEPAGVAEAASAKTVRLSFQCERAAFAGEFSDDPSTVIDETVALANHSLAQMGRAERFAILDFSDGGLVVLVPPAVLQKARKAKLIPGRQSQVEFAIGSEKQASEFARPAKKSDKSRSRRFHFETLAIDAFHDLMQRLAPCGTWPLREMLCASNGTVVLQVALATVARLMTIKEGELNLIVRDWLAGPTMQDSPYADEVAYCSDRFADVIWFLKENSNFKASVFVCVRSS